MTSPTSSATRYFIGVVSLEHAKKGYEKGFTQACHGKKGPLSKMSKGDWFVQYSPRVKMNEKKPYQKFSYIGTVSTGGVYQVEMSKGFKPFRIDINYLSDSTTSHAEIKPLIGRLSFIKNKSKWGAPFRFGFLEILRQDFAIIYESMTKKKFESPTSLEECKLEDNPRPRKKARVEANKEDNPRPRKKARVEASKEENSKF